MDTSIRVIGEVALTDGSSRDVYEIDDGRQYIVGDDGQPVAGTWLLVDEEEPDCPCDRPVLVYPEGPPAF
jgi:hypothetical protein